MKITFLAAFVALSGISVTHAQTLIFTELTRLAGTNNLELGISIDELKKRKPKVLGFPFRNAHQDIQPDDAIEILADASFFDDKYGAIWYHNLGGKLRGISICRRFSSELVENLGSFIRKQTSQGRLYSLESSQVIRSDGLRAFVVTAHHWETVTEGFKFYILATNREVNVVLYDPAFLGLDAFFVPKKELNRVQENFARLIPVRIQDSTFRIHGHAVSEVIEAAESASLANPVSNCSRTAAMAE